MDDVDSEEDGDEKPATRPYMALLQSFNDDSSAPSAKRRKLEHQDQPLRTEVPDSDEEASEGEAAENPDVDQVEEDEEDPSAGLDEQPEDDDSEVEEDSTDPFDAHFTHPNEDIVAKRVKAAQKGEWATKRALVQSLRATVMYPNSDAGPEVPKPIPSPDGLKLKQKLKEIASRKMASFDTVQQNLSPWLFEYRDILH